MHGELFPDPLNQLSQGRFLAAVLHALLARLAADYRANDLLILLNFEKLGLLDRQPTQPLLHFQLDKLGP